MCLPAFDMLPVDVAESDVPELEPRKPKTHYSGRQREHRPDPCVVQEVQVTAGIKVSEETRI